MKPPVKIDDLMEEWSNDATIQEEDINGELIKIPKLHSKYLNILIHHRMLVHKYMHQYNERKKIMWEYYTGDLNNPEDLQKYGFEPLEKKIHKPNMSMYLESDTNLNNILLKKLLHEEIVEACEFILKELNSRTFQLRAVIEWKRFTSGN